MPKVQKIVKSDVRLPTEKHFRVILAFILPSFRIDLILNIIIGSWSTRPTPKTLNITKLPKITSTKGMTDKRGTYPGLNVRRDKSGPQTRVNLSKYFLERV